MGGSTEQGMFAEERKSRIIEFINKNEKTLNYDYYEQNNNL